MYPLTYFSWLFGIEKDNHELCLDQYKSVSGQAPLFYLSIISGVIAMAYVARGQAPASMTLVMPLVLVLVDLIAFHAFTIQRNDNLASYRATVVSRLHTIVWVALILGVVHTGWAISLFALSDEVTRGLIVILLSMSTLGAALCVLQLPVAAIFLSVSSLAPLALFLWLSGDPNHQVSAVIVALSMVVFVYVTSRFGRDYAGMLMKQREVGAKKSEAEQISRLNMIMAHRDSLTDLANRRAFLSNLNAQVEDAQSGQLDGLSVGILDLDGFKLINDVYGHPAGDRLLKSVGRRLTDLFYSRVFIARLGGDEFGVTVSGERSDKDLAALGNRICAAMQVPFDLDGRVVHLGGSVGFARWTEAGDTAEILFERADYALYSGKEKLRGGVTIFNDRHAATLREITGVDRQLHDADLDKEMSLVFQPIVSICGKNTVGLEVLARWNSPVLGPVSPDVFIRSAERIGSINRVTAVLLTKALEEAKSWPPDLFMSFNLSMQDVTSTVAVLKLISIINASGFDPKRITLEVTETAVMNNYEQALGSLTLLKNLGSKIALDDFGTGYSSLAYVRTLPLDKLKLDRSFVVDLVQDSAARAVAGSMIEMCRSLNVDCIVEGVETGEQVRILNELGCEIIQGYYCSRPLSAHDARAFVQVERQNRQAI